MTPDLVALTFDAHDPPALASFWAGVLQRDVADDGTTVLPVGGQGFELRFAPTDEPKAGPNQTHFDLTSSSPDDQQATVARALGLGGRHLYVGQTPEDGHVVLADPEGNEFCVIEPGNNFLAGTGAIGALSSDGSQAVGHFWSQALGWPLVWDQDEETAVQSPRGGSKISWGGPPVREKSGRNRLRLEVAVPAGTGLPAAVERLVSLGASRADDPQREEGRVELLDPDGNEFCVSVLRDAH